jgi:hypothetical protein
VFKIFIIHKLNSFLILLSNIIEEVKAMGKSLNILDAAA